MARIRPFHGDTKDVLFKEAAAQLATLDRLLPGFRSEVFDQSVSEQGWIQHGERLHNVVRLEVNGPILTRVLTTFGAKLGMALYREHVGQALPLDGTVFVQPYLNGGLSQQQADATLSILPMTGTLKQGRREVSRQFAYAFNSDNRSIVMALATIHQNLHFLVLATSDPDHYADTVQPMFVTRISPGELLQDKGLRDFVPEIARKPFILPGLPKPPGYG